MAIHLHYTFGASEDFIEQKPQVRLLENLGERHFEGRIACAQRVRDAMEVA